MRITSKHLVSILPLALACSDAKPREERNPVDERAASHAAAVITGDEAALQNAMNDGGFALADANGNVTDSSAEQRQGTAWDVWDIAMMARTVGNGGFVTIRDLADALTVVLPEQTSMCW